MFKSRLDERLNLEDIFTKKEIESIEASYPKIKNFVNSSPIFDELNYENKLRKSEPFHNLFRLTIDKKYFYKIILDDIKCKSDKKGDRIVSKSLKSLIDDLSYEKLVNKTQTSQFISNKLNNEKLLFFKKNGFPVGLLNKNIPKETSPYLKDFENTIRYSKEEIKRLKSQSNYKNIDYYNIINSNKIINNRYKNDGTRYSQKSKFVGNSVKDMKTFNNYNLHHTQLNYFQNQRYNGMNKNKKNFPYNKNYTSQKLKFIENKQRLSNLKLSQQVNRAKYSQQQQQQHLSSNGNTPYEKKNKINNIEYEKFTGLKTFQPLNIDANIYNDIENQDFDIFEFVPKVGRENILLAIGHYIFNRLGFSKIMNYNKFENWSRKIAEGYVKSNHYHTDLHAADVTHTCLIYLKVGKVNKICDFSKNSKCALFLSCMCHDYKHPGVNNNFLKETRDKLAIKYNDASILENMHIAQTFKVINNPNNDCNIFEQLDKETYKQFRKEMISCVLSTDMSFHNVYVEFLKNYTENKVEKNESSYQYFLNTFIHSADISNPTKPFNIYFKWAEYVVEEFYDQGDKEKKLNLPCSCDRDKVTIYQSQLGFINFIEFPYFTLFAKVFENLKFYLDNLNNNKQILLEKQEKSKQS